MFPFYSEAGTGPAESRLLAAGGGTRVSAEAGQFSRWGRGARLTRRVREEPPPGELARVYSDRNATMSGAQRRGSAGMDRRLNAARVSSPVVWPGWIAGRAPTGRTGPRGFHHRLFSRDGSPAERRAGFITGCLAGMDRRSNAVWVLPPGAKRRVVPRVPSAARSDRSVRRVVRAPCPPRPDRRPQGNRDSPDVSERSRAPW